MLTRIRDNLLALQQGGRLLAYLDDLSYQRAIQPVFGSSIGAHIRHNLDHYGCFLSGLDCGCIDYGARPRNPELERNRGAALAEMMRLSRAFTGLTANPDMPLPETLRVHHEADSRADAVPSSLERELDFLLSHTIHHYAIVAILCRLQGIDVPADFGVAPSTLRFRKQSIEEAEPCAR